MIPKQLVNQRFIKVDNNKRPFEDNWQIFANYSYNDLEFNSWLKNNNRYGVLTGINNLIVIDFDDESLQNEVLGLLPDTFTVKTARKGLFHLYFFTDNPESWKCLDKDKNTLCDIQGKGKQVVGANTIIPDGRKYELVKDIDIAFISMNQLHKILDRYDFKKSIELLSNIKLTGTSSKDDSVDKIKSSFKISDLLSDKGISTSKNPTGCPLHSSKGGKCFSFDDSRGIWHCFHCEESGDVLTLYQKVHNKSFIDSKKELCERFNIEDSWKSNRIKVLQKKMVSSIKDNFDMTEQVRRFIEEFPIFYDINDIWWLWDSDNGVWIRLSDDTDILVLLFESDIVIPELNKISRQNEFLSLLRIMARASKPKEPSLEWIQFGNMIYDLSTGKEFLASPEYFFINSLPFKPSEDSTTPIMDKLFIEWVGLENVDLLYQIIAYCCYRDYPIHHLFCFVGSGSNGKSTFLQIVNKFIGLQNVTTVSLDTLMNSRFEVASLYKKLVCQMGETNFSTISRTEILKKLTGQDMISFEFKNKNPFSEKNYAKILISTNTLPETTDKTDGFYRRWVTIDFPNKFSGDVDVLKYIPEYEYNNLSRKVINLLPSLLESRKFKGVGSIIDRKLSYESKSNPLPKFLHDYCVDSTTGYIPKWEFKTRFNDFLIQNNLRSRSDTEIGLRMKELYDDKKVHSDDTGNYIRCWTGLRWKDDRKILSVEEESILNAKPF